MAIKYIETRFANHIIFVKLRKNPGFRFALLDIFSTLVHIKEIAFFYHLIN